MARDSLPLGFIVIVALSYRNIVGATLIGIIAVTLLGIPLGLAEFTGIISAPPSLAPTFLQLDFPRAAELTFIIIVFSKVGASEGGAEMMPVNSARPRG